VQKRLLAIFPLAAAGLVVLGGGIVRFEPAPSPAAHAVSVVQVIAEPSAAVYAGANSDALVVGMARKGTLLETSDAPSAAGWDYVTGANWFGWIPADAVSSPFTVEGAAAITPTELLGRRD